MDLARACALLTLCCSCLDDEVTIAPGTNAVRCECACGVGLFTATRTVEVCIDRDIEPSGADFTAADLTSICDDACLGGVQAQAQESLVAEDIVDDACVVSCDRTAPPEGLRMNACGDGEQRIDCAAERCPVDLPADPALVRYYLLRCTQVVDDSRVDAAACGPDRPTRPLCVVDMGMAGGDEGPAPAVSGIAPAPTACGSAGAAMPAALALLCGLRVVTTLRSPRPHAASRRAPRTTTGGRNDANPSSQGGTRPRSFQRPSCAIAHASASWRWLKIL